MPSDLRTRAIVLRRTNYQESDRILSLLTPEGKFAALARGVRKEKSRLAGSIELFSVADVVLHQGKSQLTTLTGAKMLHFFSQLLTDVAALELAASMMKHVERATEQVNSPEYFTLLFQSLNHLNQKLDSTLVRTWFMLNLQRINGEELNLIYDINGNKLDPKERYSWDLREQSLRPYSSGDISAREIKFLRFLLSNPLSWAAKVDNYAEILPHLAPIVSAPGSHY